LLNSKREVPSSESNCESNKKLKWFVLESDTKTAVKIEKKKKKACYRCISLKEGLLMYLDV